jgi:hypothetical protein
MARGVLFLISTGRPRDSQSLADFRWWSIVDMRLRGLLLITGGLIIGYLSWHFVHWVLSLTGEPFVIWGLLDLHAGIVSSRSELGPES